MPEIIINKQTDRQLTTIMSIIIINYLFLKSHQRFFVLTSSFSVPSSLVHFNSLFTRDSAAIHRTTSILLQHHFVTLSLWVAVLLHPQPPAPTKNLLLHCCPRATAPLAPLLLLRHRSSTAPPHASTLLSQTSCAPCFPEAPATNSFVPWSPAQLLH